EPLSVILKYAASRGGMPLPIAVHVAIQASRGLHAAHELRDDSGAIVGLVHRDVSPQNVLLTYDGVVKVVDFGVAKVTNRASGETRAGQLKGKIAYMSPEQLRSEKIDRRTDVFAMGILLYMMTTGRHPFRGEDEPETIRTISSDEPAALPSTLAANYPAALEQIVMQALAKDPAKRYPTANDIVVALSRAMPPSTDEEVAAFLRTWLPDRLEKRKAMIKAALEAADRREQPSSARQSAPQSMSIRETSDESATKREGLISHHHLTPSTDASLPGALTGQELAGVRSRPPASRGRLARSIVSVALIATVLLIVAAAVMRGQRPVEGSNPVLAPGEPSKPAAAAEPVALAPTPSTATSAIEDLAVEPSASASGAARPPSVVRRPARPATTKASGTATKRKGTFVSPIRNPGF
ncbi:MAG TPA: serine/threonine-protein kinase, partial [Polyangiaceae bacterium]|nr:serine/threonine-protein kinase [Polyangiaceae bacterium]